MELVRVCYVRIWNSTFILFWIFGRQLQGIIATQFFWAVIEGYSYQSSLSCNAEVTKIKPKIANCIQLAQIYEINKKEAEIGVTCTIAISHPRDQVYRHGNSTIIIVYFHLGKWKPNSIRQSFAHQTSEMLDSSNFIRLFHRQTFSLSDFLRYTVMH